MFSEVAYRDGWQLFWRLKWRYLYLVCFEFLLFFVVPLTELFGQSLVSSISGTLIFLATYCVMWVFTYYSRYIGVLRSDPLRVRYYPEFRLFFRFWIKVQLKLLLILVFVVPAFYLFFDAFVPGIVAPFFAGENFVAAWKSSPETWPWLIGCYFIFSCITAILNALYAAKIAGGNAGVLHAFRRVPEGFTYIVSRGLVLFVVGLGIWLALSAFPLELIVATPLNIGLAAGILVMNAALRMGGYFIDSIWTVLSCRLYLKSDGNVHLSQTKALTMPYLS